MRTLPRFRLRRLRELNRPRLIAYWSQGAHRGWGRTNGRACSSPTPDELRQQASRACTFTFSLPAYLSSPVEVFRVDASGVTDIERSVGDRRVTIHDQVSGVAIYVATIVAGERERIDARRRALLAEEVALEFNPGENGADLDVLRQILDVDEN